MGLQACMSTNKFTNRSLSVVYLPCMYLTDPAIERTHSLPAHLKKKKKICRP